MTAPASTRIWWASRIASSFVVGIAGVENQHLEILSKIAIVFSDEDEVAAMLAATSAEEILDILGEVNA